jgi:hypothetical protein
MCRNPNIASQKKIEQSPGPRISEHVKTHHLQKIMFRSLLTVLLIAMASVSQAAQLFFDTDNNVAKQDGSPLNSGVIRFGWFPAGTDFSDRHL